MTKKYYEFEVAVVITVGAKNPEEARKIVVDEIGGKFMDSNIHSIRQGREV